MEDKKSFQVRNQFIAFVFVIVLTPVISVFGQEAVSSVVVRVQDENGNAITDVRKENFALEFNKKPQSILEIRRWDRGQYLIVLDLAFASLESVGAVREKIWNFLSSMKPEDVAAIVVFDRKEGFRVPCPFTSDRRQWLHTLNHLEESGQREDAAGFHFSQSFDEQEPALADLKTVQPGLAKLMQGQFSRDELESTANKFTAGLTGLARSLAVVRGAKEVLLFSPGIAASRAPQTELEEPELQQSIPDPGDETEPDFEPTATQRSANPAEAIAEYLLASGSVAFTLDTSGIGKPATSGKSFLTDIAKRTNGVYFAQLPEDLNAIQSASPAFIMSWKTSGDSKEINNLKITSTQKHKILAPKQIPAPRSVSSFNNAERQLFFSQWIYNDSSGKLSPVAAIDFFPAEKKLIKSQLFLQMHGKDLVDSNFRQRSIHMAGYLMDSEKKLVDYFFMPVRMNADQTRDRLIAGGLNFFDVLLSPPGDYSLRGMIVDVDRSEVTTFLLPVKVPNFSALMMTVPVIPTQLDQGIMIRREYNEDTKRGLRVTYPYETAQGIFHPDPAPKVNKGKAYFLYYHVYNLALDPSQRPSPQLGIILKSPNGEEKPIGDVVISDRREISKTDYALLLQFQIRDVKPGAYSLVPYVRDGIANKTIWQQTNIEVIDK